MRASFLAAALVLLPMAAPAVAKPVDKTVTVQVHNVPADVALLMIAKSAGMNVLIPGGMPMMPVSLNLTNLDAMSAFRTVCLASELDFKTYNGVMIVFPARMKVHVSGPTQAEADPSLKVHPIAAPHGR